MSAPLVSVVMPAYKARYLSKALASVQRQTHRPLELVVCDDSHADYVRQIVEAFAAAVDFPVHYSRNPSRLWETRSTARAIGIASGEFVKILHDDDVLHATCIAAQLEVFARHPDVTLVSARRRLINETGASLPDRIGTAYPAGQDLLFDGDDLVDFIASHTLNFIGEPSAVMCRRAPLLAMGERLSWLGEHQVTWVADLALYVKLLRHGRLAMLGTPLVDFRVSRQQFSQYGRDRPGVGDPGHEALRDGIQALGWSRPERDARLVEVTPLDGSAPATTIDLLDALQQAQVAARIQWSRHDWQSRRTPRAGQTPGRDHDAGPLLGVLVLAANATPAALRDTLASLVTAGSRVRGRVLGNAPPADTGVDVEQVGWDPTDPTASLNAALADWDVEWVMLVDAGTLYGRAGLRRLLPELAAADGLHALYADGWYRDARGVLAPVMQTALNLDLLLGNPATLAQHWVIRRQTLIALGGFDPDHAAAAPLDLALRLLEREGLGAVGHLAEPLLVCPPPHFDPAAQRNALLRHLHARGYADASVDALPSGLYRIGYGHAQPGSVSIIVIAPTTLAPLERCVVSLLEKTSHPQYELLLVDNGGDPAIAGWMGQVEALAGGRVRVLALDPPLADPAAVRNLAAGQAAGEHLLFLDADTAVLQADWLEQLLEQGQRPEVGIVGARTVSADGQITHAGLVPGLRAGNGRVFLGQPMDALGYMGRLQVPVDYSAVSGSCLMIRRELFEQLQGFDPAAGSAADVDLCLRTGAAGHLIVWTPHATLLQAIDTAQPTDEAAQEFLCKHWLSALTADPAYSPTLHLDVSGGFELDQSELSLPRQPGAAPRVLVQPSDQHGSGHYRIIEPFHALAAAGLVDGACVNRPLDVVEVARFDPDVLVAQRRGARADIERIARLRRHTRAFKVYELDDYLPALSASSVHRRHMPADIARLLREGLAHMDRLVVSTPALANAMAGFHGDIRVVANRLDPQRWTGLPVPAGRRAGARPRVGWAGGVGHGGDLEMIAEVVRSLAGEVDWVFLGMCPERLRPHVVEVHPGVPIDAYPRVLARLDLDVALAPLEDHLFNRCKSNLRLLEYGACGYPVVCSDITPYRGDLPVTRVRNRTRDWVDAIRMHLADPDAARQAGLALREAVHAGWLLAGAGLDGWREAWLPD